MYFNQEEMYAYIRGNVRLYTLKPKLLKAFRLLKSFKSFKSFKNLFYSKKYFLIDTTFVLLTCLTQLNKSVIRGVSISITVVHS